MLKLVSISVNAVFVIFNVVALLALYCPMGQVFYWSGQTVRRGEEWEMT